MASPAPRMTSEELRAYRRSRGLSQSDFALWIGVSLSTVSRWERDVQRIPAAVKLITERPLAKGESDVPTDL